MATLCLAIGVIIAWPENLWPGISGFIPSSNASTVTVLITKVTSVCSVYLLQTLSYFFSVQDGLLKIHDTTFDLAQASGGLRTLIAVFAFSVAAAALANKPLWERAFIAISGLPIGITCSVFRVTTGCVLAAEVSEVFGRMILIDLAGWVTLTLTVPCLLVERALLSRLLIPPPDRETVPVLRRSESLVTQPKPDIDSPSVRLNRTRSIPTEGCAPRNSASATTEGSLGRRLEVTSSTT